MFKSSLKFLLGVFLLLWQVLLFAAPAQLTKCHLDKKDRTATRLVFELNKLPHYEAFSLPAPQRLVIDLLTTTKSGNINCSPLEHTLVKNVRTGAHDDGSLRVVLDLTKAAPYHIKTASDAKHHKASLIVDVGKFTEPTPPKKIAKAKQEITAKQTEPKNISPINHSNLEALPGTKNQHKNAPQQKEPLATAASLPITPTKTPSTKLTPPTLSKNTISIATPKNNSESFFAKLSKVSKELFFTKTTQAQQQLTAITKATKKSDKIGEKIHSGSEQYAMTLVEPNSKHPHRDVIIVIDPGHGGRDAGAHGKNKVKEKDVVLAIAKKLQRYLNQQDGFSAILTRDGDYYVGLHERLRIAHVNRADIFLSLHADAYKNSSIKGTTIFVLSQDGASSEAARWLAERENISELNNDQGKHKDLLHSVLINLAQSASVNSSTIIAKTLLFDLSVVQKLHTQRVEHANFVVLQSPDIPSMLIETGFISDPKDELKLSNDNYQEQFAATLARSIITYFTIHPPQGTSTNSSRATN